MIIITSIMFANIDDLGSPLAKIFLDSSFMSFCRTVITKTLCDLEESAFI
jgi:hypothetical protein